MMQASPEYRLDEQALEMCIRYSPEFDEEALDSLVATVARFPFSVIKGKVYGDVSMKEMCIRDRDEESQL